MRMGGSRRAVWAAVMGALLVLLFFVVWRSHGQSAAAPDTVAQQHDAAASTPAGRVWAAGACQMLAPQGDGKHVTIFLDPGHGAPDPGTQGTTTRGTFIYEKDLTLATTQMLAGLLRADGYTVVMSRVQDGSVAALTSADLPDGVFSAAGKHKDLLARVACANASHAAVLLSLHFNGFSNHAVGGVETFYDDARSFSAQNLALAKLVQQNVVAQLAAAGWNVPDRGVSPDSSDAEPTLTAEAAAYNHLLELGPAQPGYLDQPSGMPGVLVEPLFLTDPFEADIAADPRGQGAIAQGIATAIEQFLGANPPQH
jgi:N-acetylmuramoyl-L-alanine amidase